MMWNHRIIKYDDGTLGIHEVYYDEDDKVMFYSSEAQPVMGDDFEDLELGYNLMEQAFHAPILNMCDLPKEEEDN